MEALKAAEGPIRARDIWQGHKVSLGTVHSVLVRLERQGVVVRKRRFDEDGHEMASHWWLAGVT